MFITKTPIMVVDDESKPADAQSMLHLRADLTLAQHDGFWAEYDRMQRHYTVLAAAQEELLIFKHRLIGWSGPQFDGVAFTPENVNLLDYNNPLVERGIVAAYKAHYQIPPDPPDPDPKANASAIPLMTAESNAG